MTFADVLRKYQGERSLREFAALLGVEPATLSRLYRHQRRGSYRAMVALLREFPQAGYDLAAMAARHDAA